MTQAAKLARTGSAQGTNIAKRRPADGATKSSVAEPPGGRPRSVEQIDEAASAPGAALAAKPAVAAKTSVTKRASAKQPAGSSPAAKVVVASDALMDAPEKPGAIVAKRAKTVTLAPGFAGSDKAARARAADAKALQPTTTRSTAIRTKGSKTAGSKTTAPKPNAGGAGGCAPIKLGFLSDFVGFHLRLAQDASYRAFARFKEKDLVKPGRFPALAIIHLNPGISQSALGRAIARDKSTVSPLIKDLQKNGLINRKPSPNDRRSVTLVLTKKGERVLDRLHIRAREHENDLDKLVGASKVKLVSLLDKITAALTA